MHPAKLNIGFNVCLDTMLMDENTWHIVKVRRVVVTFNVAMIRFQCIEFIDC